MFPGVPKNFIAHLRMSTATKRRTKGTKKRVVRATSNVFAMFDQNQIHEFKEAFNIIDQNRDGFIDTEDLKNMFDSLGQDKGDAYYKGMVEEAMGPINFTMFMTLFADKMNGTDPEDVIRNAFASFDKDGEGRLHEDQLNRLMLCMGDRWAFGSVISGSLTLFYAFISSFPFSLVSNSCSTFTLA